MAEQLPIEIFQLIASSGNAVGRKQLESYRRALKTMSTVCPAWRRPAQALLFQDSTFKVTTDSFDRINSAFDDCPGILDLFKAASFGPTSKAARKRFHDSDDSDDVTDVFNPGSGSVQLVDFVRIMCDLTRLESVKITTTQQDFWYSPMRMRRLDIEFAPTLTSFEWTIDGTMSWVGIIRLLDLMPNLHSFSLNFTARAHMIDSAVTLKMLKHLRHFGLTTANHTFGLAEVLPMPIVEQIESISVKNFDRILSSPRIAFALAKGLKQINITPTSPLAQTPKTIAFMSDAQRQQQTLKIPNLSAVLDALPVLANLKTVHFGSFWRLPGHDNGVSLFQAVADQLHELTLEVDNPDWFMSGGYTSVLPVLE